MTGRPRLTDDERTDLVDTAGGESIHVIARRLGRAPSTIHREIKIKPAG